MGSQRKAKCRSDKVLLSLLFFGTNLIKSKPESSKFMFPFRNVAVCYSCVMVCPHNTRPTFLKFVLIIYSIVLFTRASLNDDVSATEFSKNFKTISYLGTHLHHGMNIKCLVRAYTNCSPTDLS